MIYRVPCCIQSIKLACYVCFLIFNPFFSLLSATVLLFTVPVLYEKYEDKVDHFGEKAMKEIKKQYAVLDEKVLSKVMSKIPRGAFNKMKD